ncbi:hypothetical protein WA026_009131 [Henosepilachna vigintioctopunctata]|uniref:PiggyBac transposable element-derived protein domain-containing protein n=1 Tax=Henosepilachna vigintioctopunctata TaxID=420089 RepID=A0AAW1UUS9_9CUCU
MYSLNSHSLNTQKLFGATGSVGENRTNKWPIKSAKDLTEEPRGTFDYRYDTESDILMVRWYDNKCVKVAKNYEKIQRSAEKKR